MMKNILKSLGTGVLFGLMSLAAYAFGAGTVEAFVAMSSAIGWEAVGLTVAGLLMGFMTLFVVFMMGAIPLSSIESLKSKLEEKEHGYD